MDHETRYGARRGSGGERAFEPDEEPTPRAQVLIIDPARSPVVGVISNEARAFRGVYGQVVDIRCCLRALADAITRGDDSQIVCAEERLRFARALFDRHLRVLGRWVGEHVQLAVRSRPSIAALEAEASLLLVHARRVRRSAPPSIVPARVVMRRRRPRDA